MKLRSALLSLFIILSSLFISGCGYKPTSYYAKNAISGKVYVDLKMDIENSTNAVIIKDTVNEMIIGQFKAGLTSIKSEADTLVAVKFGSISHKVLETDRRGYTKTYRTSIKIDFKYTNKLSNKKDTLSVKNYSDYEVAIDSVVTEQNKQESIRLAAKRALEDLFSKIAVRSIAK